MEDHSSTLSSSYRYDVFISFRGEDTRRNFVSHLDRELRRKVTTFKDDRILQPGDSLPEELPEAIKESKIAVVVISKNYASSSWCLDELQMIMELKRKKMLDVIPIFYQVVPSDVRKLKGTFAEAFVKYEASFFWKLFPCLGFIKKFVTSQQDMEKSEKVSKWKEALIEVANLTGVVSQQWQDEAEMVYDVGENILDRLLAMSPKGDSDLIGMDTQFEALKPLLSIGSDDEVRMIGLWGMGGTGKTTIAKYLFEKFSCQFPFRCFVENVKKIHSERGRENLRRLFLSQILNDERLKSESFVLMSNTIQDRLSGKKVLAILDDVDNPDQLEALAKHNSWFGPGSRIIITTRDNSLLNIACEEKYVHKVECLDPTTAYSFFNYFAFSGGPVPREFESLAKSASKLVGGLPLALKVLGLYLHGREKDVWEVAARKLRDYPHESVMNCLQVSYDGLSKENQGIFLTVACLFNQKHASHVSQFLEGEEREVKISLDKLAEKALIGISTDGKVIVHDLMHDMAKEIVNNKPGRPRYLLDSKETVDVLVKGMGTDAMPDVEGISLAKFPIYELPMGHRGFENMQNLRYLKIHDAFYSSKNPISDVINHLPPRLRLLDWTFCFLKTLPPTFRAEFLVELRLIGSRIVKLSEGKMSLGNLRRMDLRRSYQLKDFPILKGATKLEELNLRDCSNLVKVPPSFPRLDKLNRLTMSGCENLRLLPYSTGLKSLKIINLRGCSSLESFPELPESVVELNMGRTGLKEVPESVKKLVALEVLSLWSCRQLLEISRRISDLTALGTLDLSSCEILSELPDTIGKLQSVAKLDLQNCQKLKSIPDSIGCLTGLKTLDLSYCKGLSEIPSTIGDLTTLTALDCQSCEMLSAIPSGIGNLTTLTTLNLSRCENLLEIPSTVGDLISLTTLNLSRCKKLLEIPSTIGHLTALTTLNLGFCWMLSEIPRTIGYLSALTTLILNSCWTLSEIPRTIGDLQSIKKLILADCKSLENIPDTIGKLTTLEDLSLMLCPKLHNIPNTIGNLTALTTLNLSDCEMLSEIPSSIGDLMALKTLKLNGCPMLSNIPVTIGNLTNLENVYSPEDIYCVYQIVDALWGKNQHFKLRSSDWDMEVDWERAFESHAIEVFGLCLKYGRCFGKRSHRISLSIFQHLRKLSLCNLNIREILDDLNCLYALQSLDLSGNSFEVLPKSIEQLFLLEELVLSECRMLRTMPKLPQGVKYLYANGCRSLKSISHVSEHPFLRLMLNSRYKLRQDPLLIIQHMISMPFRTESANAWACFSGVELPVCFYHRKKGQKLTIHCPGALKPVGFVAGIVVESLGMNTVSRLNMCCLWYEKGNRSGCIHVDPKSLPSHLYNSDIPRELLLILTCMFEEEKSCDEISLMFDFSPDVSKLHSGPKIKECGVHLYFIENSQQTQALLTLKEEEEGEKQEKEGEEEKKDDSEEEYDIDNDEEDEGFLCSLFKEDEEF